MMAFFSKINKFILNSEARFDFLNSLGIYRRMSDEHFVKKGFKAIMKKELNLDNPKTFNEKLQWLKLYDRKPIYTSMVDKYEVKKYVSSVIGEEYIIPTLGVWEHFDDIDFEKLPKQFVLKCTHDSGGLVICKDKTKFDKASARIKLEKCLKNNFYWAGREWPYKNVRPRIIAEKYMEDTALAELRDYKFFCFDGVAKCYKVDFDRFTVHKANYFNAEGEIVKIGEVVCPPDFEKKILIPENLEKMKAFAEKLSAGHPFLRVDFYEVDGQVYFGELTFYPNNGFGKFIYEGNDELLGSWIKLPKIRDNAKHVQYKSITTENMDNISDRDKEHLIKELEKLLGTKPLFYLKFCSAEQYAIDVCEGRLFANTPEVFRKKEIESGKRGQGDRYELTSIIEAKAILVSNAETDEDIYCMQNGTLKLNFKEDDLVPMLSFVGVTLRDMELIYADENHAEFLLPFTEKENETMVEEFGKFCVIINGKELNQHIDSYCKENKYNYIFDKIEYCEQNRLDRMQAFYSHEEKRFLYKNKDLAYQREYRLVVEQTMPVDHFIRIGKLTNTKILSTDIIKKFKFSIGYTSKCVQNG